MINSYVIYFSTSVGCFQFQKKIIVFCFGQFLYFYEIPLSFLLPSRCISKLDSPFVTISLLLLVTSMILNWEMLFDCKSSICAVNLFSLGKGITSFTLWLSTAIDSYSVILLAIISFLFLFQCKQCRVNSSLSVIVLINWTFLNLLISLAASYIYLNFVIYTWSVIQVRSQRNTR